MILFFVVFDIVIVVVRRCVIIGKDVCLQIGISFCVTYFFCVFSSVLILGFIYILFKFIKNSRIEIIIKTMNNLNK